MLSPPCEDRACETDIQIEAPHRLRLEAIVATRSSPHKYAWRAQIILLTAQSLGTQMIIVATGKFKNCGWRGQERLMAET